MAQRKIIAKTEKLPQPTPRHASRRELDSIEEKTSTERSDFELLKLFVQRQSQDAFETLVTRHRRQVYNFIFKMVGKAEAAEDIFQETFLRVLKNAHTYTPRAKFTTWCLQIARNLSLDYFKREGLRRHASLDAQSNETERSLGQMLAGVVPESSEVLISREMIEGVREAVTRLPENQREALVLRIYQDMQYSEIAEILDSPEGTVKYWVHEAVGQLARWLEKKGLS